MSAKIPPKPSKDVIYVDVDDEITSIIDKVENAEHKVVALVLPKRAASLQSIVNMKLLKRSADTAGKSAVLITSEHALLPLAGAAGLHVAKNLQTRPEIPEAPAGSAKVAATDSETTEVDAEAEESDNENEDLPQKFDYSKPIGALAAKHEAENPETIDLEDEDEEKPAKSGPKVEAVKSKLKVPNFDRFRMGLGLGIGGLIALIFFLILALAVWPKATITITTTSEQIAAEFNLTASTKAKSLDTKAGILPAKLETKDQNGSQQVTATGQKNNGDKATGNVTFSIPCASVGGEPPEIPAGTGVSTGGLTFITQSNAKLDNPDFSGGCHFTDTTNITASAAGSKYNVSGATFTISGNYPNVSASGSASGGTDDIVTILSQSDVDNAKQKLTSGSAGQDFVKDFEKELTDQGDYVLNSTLKTGDAKITASPAVGEPASNASVNIKITYTVLTVKKDELSQAIQAKLADKIDKNKQKLSDSFFEDATITVQSQSSSKTALLQISENTTVVPIINVASVKAVAKGHKTGDVKSAISGWPGVQSVDVKLSPFWVSKVPGKDSKITVVLKEVKSTPTNSEQP